MKTITIHNTPSFRIDSTGNGLSYDFTHKKQNKYVFFQGDDAIEFENELKAYEKAFPDMEYENLLTLLWNDYSDISAKIHKE